MVRLACLVCRRRRPSLSNWILARHEQLPPPLIGERRSSSPDVAQTRLKLETRGAVGPRELNSRVSPNLMGLKAGLRLCQATHTHPEAVSGRFWNFHPCVYGQSVAMYVKPMLHIKIIIRRNGRRNYASTKMYTYEKLPDEISH